MTIREILTAIVKDKQVTETWIGPITAACQKFEINTPKRVAAFIAQMAHESNGFKSMSENLNYSAEALRAKFGKYFTTASAQKYGRTAAHSADWVAIASIIYANRMGNGPADSMEGWKYRGRGPGQLTGKNNYLACGLALDLPLWENPDLVAQPEVGALAFGWFWSKGNSTGKSLNVYADAWNIDAISDIINLGHATKAHGDSFGFEERLALSNAALKAAEPAAVT